ncbi:vWA domain-containing protein [Actinokineospora pegani]|uniref:vWA domain-containing protein n=1 Tax=Actinokineospora pegani TaxID=2654637 RepID=UPI0012EA4C1B|nr:vWA domain-containing protein [Actinokineospora pegani]
MAQPTRTRRGKAGLVVGAVLGVLALVVAVITVDRLTDRPSATGPCVEFEVSASTEKDQLIADMATAYNGSGRSTRAGRCVEVSVHGLTSGTAATMLSTRWDADEAGAPQPQVWLPSTSLWLRVVAEPGKPSISVDDVPPSIASSAVVLAMPQPMADVLLERAPQPGWSDLIELSKAPGGWAAHGHPEWGEFVLGRDNPLFSSSGLGATVATYHAASLAVTGGEPTDATVSDPRVSAFVHDVESSVGSYGDDAAKYAVQIYEEDRKNPEKPFVSAIVMQEQLVHLYNLGVPDGDPAKLANPSEKPNRPLTAIYPKDGTVVFDHPFIVLGGATLEQREAADDFRAFLLEEDQRARLSDAGFRPPVDAEGRAGQPTEQLGRTLGLSPNQALTPLPPPTPAVLQRMVKGWEETRKPARVLIVLDVSGSMNEPAVDDGTTASPASDKSKIELLKPAVKEAAQLLGDADSVALWSFSSPGHTEVLPMTPVRDVADRLDQAVDGLVAKGNTDLYRTVIEAHRKMTDEIDARSINAIVLLTDGANFPDDPAGRDRMLATVDAQQSETSVRIFTIPYGKGADVDTLRQIAVNSKALWFDAKTSPTDISDVFVSAFSNL